MPGAFVVAGASTLRLPRQPGDEAVNVVAPRRLVDVQLIVAAQERVPATAHPIGERKQDRDAGTIAAGAQRFRLPWWEDDVDRHVSTGRLHPEVRDVIAQFWPDGSAGVVC